MIMRLFRSRKTKSYDDCFREGMTNYMAGHLEKAYECFSQAIDLCPNIPQAVYQRGMALARMGRMSAAIQDFEHVIQLAAPDRMKRDACYNLGKAYDELQQHKESIHWYSQAIWIDPKFANAYSNRASARLKLAHDESSLPEYEIALEDLGHALFHNPSDALAYYNRAIIHVQLGKMEQVPEDVEKFLDLAPQNHPYRREMEKLLAESGQQPSPKLEMIRERKKKELLEKIIKANNEEQHAEAIQYCDQYLALSQIEPTVWDEKAFALSVLGQPENALAVCTEGIRLNPAGARLYHTKGLILVQFQRYHEAIGAFEKYLAMAPSEYAENIPSVRQMIKELERRIGK